MANVDSNNVNSEDFNSKKVFVLGGGSFGTVISNIAAENGNRVFQWMRDKSRADEITRHKENKRYMPGYPLSPNLVATTDVNALSDADVIFFSIPGKSFREICTRLAGTINKKQILVSTTKGVEKDTFKLMSQILTEFFPENPIGVLSGPNLAKEIGRHQLSATVVASESPAVRTAVQELLGSRTFRVYANVDIYGVELGGALKNIYAIILGMADAMKMGENTKAMLITRSLAEMSRFAEKMGANPLTFLGLAGVGDLIVTCSSPLSRNFRVGYAVGKGQSLDEAVGALGEVAEGVNTVVQVHRQAQQSKIYMPLVTGLYVILFENKKISEVVTTLMLAQQSTDVEFVLSREEHLGG
ncbi:MAG: NAD(P)H-dependent glycerol-3-phosphate dehydrogenase [Proteobacteria bacterium]|nr:MAG: NAD(P)H-dependent glycerol-3-phosphate dehydrogenase [Pseudomonadota bacterium]